MNTKEKAATFGRHLYKYAGVTDKAKATSIIHCYVDSQYNGTSKRSQEYMDKCFYDAMTAWRKQRERQAARGAGIPDEVIRMLEAQRASK